MTESIASTNYRMAPKARFRHQLALVAIAFVPIATLTTGLWIGSQSLLVIALALSAGVLPLGIPLFRQLREVRLTVSPQGVTLSRVLGKEPVALRWEEIERLELCKGQSALILKSPLDHPGTQRMAMASRVRFSDASNEQSAQAELMHQRRWIPFSYFSEWLTSGSLIDDLQKYAPELVRDLTIDRANKAIANRQGRKISGLLCLAALLILCALAADLYSSLPLAARGEGSLAWIVLARFPAILWSFTILLMIPVLGVYAFINLAAALREWRGGDRSSAMTSLFMSIIQAAFALWIAGAILFAERK